MSEQREAIGVAVKQQKLLAAKMTVREEALTSELAELAREKAALGDGNDALGAALGEKMAQLESERSEARAQRAAALAELGELGKLAGKLPAMEAQALAEEALAFTGAEDHAPPHARLTDDEARAELARLRAQRAAGAEPAATEPAAATDRAAADAPPTKRTF